MADWTVTPSQGVTNNNDGTFIFPENNTYCDKEYTVEYTDSGCTCSITVVVNGQFCFSDYEHNGYGDGGTINNVPCEGGTYSVSANVPYKYTGRTVVNCECVETGRGETTIYETVQVDVPRNCGSAGEWYDSKDYISYKVKQAGGCGYLGKCPINNCSAGSSCEEGSGCDGHMSVSPSGSSWSTPYGQDSFAISSNDITVTTSSDISYSVQSTTGGASGYGWYRISFTGSKSEWENYKSGDTVGWYDVSCSKSGYCGYHNTFRIYVKKS